MRETQTFYYENASGSLRQRDTNEESPEHPDGWTQITAAAYATKLAAIEEARATQTDEITSREQAERQAAYTQLTALPGITDAVARRLSGYSGPAGG